MGSEINNFSHNVPNKQMLYNVFNNNNNKLPSTDLLQVAINKNKSILLVEDDEVSTKLIKFIVNIIKCQLVSVKDGKKAIDFLEKNIPNLILMDINLPIMNGVEVTKWIRTRDKLKHIPIIAITSYAMVGDRERFIEAGCSDYLAKPFDIKQLTNMITNYLTVTEKKT